MTFLTQAHFRKVVSYDHEPNSLSLNLISLERVVAKVRFSELKAEKNDDTRMN